jgi:hypothetical protein
MDIDEVVAQQEIRDVLIRYTRGIDRMDVELVTSSYHPDAHDDHGAFQGGIDAFIDWLRSGVWSYYDTTTHFIGNQLVEVAGDVAHAESYCVAYHRRSTREDEVGHDLVIGLRYVDRMERRDGEWRIADRRCVFDWSRRDPIVGEWQLPEQALRGRRDRNDPVYR